MIRKIAAITAAAGAIVAGGLATTPAHADEPYPEHVELENFDVTFHGNTYPPSEGPSGTGWMSADVTVCAKNVAPVSGCGSRGTRGPSPPRPTP